MDGHSADAGENDTVQQYFSSHCTGRVPLRGGGFFFPEVDIGARVEAGDKLGTIHAPGYDKKPRSSPAGGTVIGMAVPQIVLSGYALFNIGIEGSDVFPGLLLQESSDPRAPEIDG